MTVPREEHLNENRIKRTENFHSERKKKNKKTNKIKRSGNLSY